ncbi:hypothetical protein [Cognatishimia activa]|uniref:Uncharacterized protein n=1 Tax=Cognatishimia activa TaxID=1715691 RepID=A0A0P1IKY6_9RHOB|nr:hypothetical protein [Cognatishimia activa]CUI27483.1 hypothetical protein TA5113_00048 [Cognatishimia activa]CUK24241.1 hypothetical protein TA5114_00016 [Cognatishimia activa]
MIKQLAIALTIAATPFAAQEFTAQEAVKAVEDIAYLDAVDAWCDNYMANAAMLIEYEMAAETMEFAALSPKRSVTWRASRSALHLRDLKVSFPKADTQRFHAA